MTQSDYTGFLDKLPNSHSIIGRQNSAAVLAPFVELKGRMFLLLEKRAEGIPQAGEICFPGGRPDSEDENLLATALRETREELGIGGDRITADGLLGTLIAGPGMVDVYVGKITAKDRSDFNISKDEVDKLLLVPFDWFLDNEPAEYRLESEYKPVDEPDSKPFPARELGLPEKYWTPWRGRPHTIYVYNYENEIIWGMTARMIQEMVRLYE